MSYIGTLIMGACGDILGSQTEGMTRSQIENKFGGEFATVSKMPEKKLYTDDTDMTIILARHLIKNRGTVDRDQLHAEYANGNLEKGYSKKTRNILERIKKREKKIGRGFATTNGAIMRIAPLGLVKFDNDKELLCNIQNALYYTHLTEEAIASAFIFCKIIRKIVTNAFGTRYDLLSYILQKSAIFPPLFTKLNLMSFCIAQAEDPSKYDINITYELTGNRDTVQIEAMDCLACALYLYFRYYGDPKKAICEAASLGGDTDTIAKLVGDLVGATWGVTENKDWENIEGQDELISLGKQFRELAQEQGEMYWSGPR